MSQLTRGGKWNFPSAAERATHTPTFTVPELTSTLGVPRGTVMRLIRNLGIEPRLVSANKARYALKPFQEALNAEAGARVYKIENNVPLASRFKPKSPDSVRVEATLNRMSPGDSVLINPDDRALFSARAKFLKIRVATRAEGPRVRVWRLDKPDSN